MHIYLSTAIYTYTIYLDVYVIRIGHPYITLFKTQKLVRSMSVTIFQYILACNPHISRNISYITFVAYTHYTTYTYSLILYTYTPTNQPLVRTLSSTRSGNNQQANLSIVADIVPRLATVYQCTDK